MIKPKPMQKITVFGPKTFMKPVIEKLYDMDVVHIEDYTKKSEEEVFDIGEPFHENESYSETLVKLRTLISNLGVKNMPVETSSTSFNLIQKKTNQIYEKASALLEKKEFFSQILKIYKQKVEKALAFLKIDEPHSKWHYVGFINAKYEILQKEIEKITKSKFHSVNYQGITLIAVFVNNLKVEKLLANYDFSPIDNPVIKKEFKLKSKSATKFVKLNYEVEVIERKLRTLDTEITNLRDEHSIFLLESKARLKNETDKAEAPLKFATTKNTFLIKGWIPRVNQAKLENCLNKITNGRVMLKFEKPKKGDDVPIAFNHNKLVQPFEAFMNMYTLPSYKEIDPTFFMFLTFPLFFGFMLGDVGYGLVIFGIFSLLKKKMPSAKNILNAFIIASLASIVFGVVFGEYFGYEEVSPQIANVLGIDAEKVELHGETEIIYPIPHIFSRSHGLEDLLSMSILFGIVHLLIGFIIGFINVNSAHGFKHAVYEKGGWILIMPLIVWLLLNFLKIIKGFVAEMLNMILPSLPIVAALFLLGAILVIKGEGIIGLIEVIFLALLSNILSYARLMAVGLASLSLALVINDMAGSMFRSGFFGIIMGILILILGHTINIALGVLSPFLHSLRLHYVEFFGKFFKGGGRRYITFGYRE